MARLPQTTQTPTQDKISQQTSLNIPYPRHSLSLVVLVKWSQGSGKHNHRDMGKNKAHQACTHHPSTVQTDRARPCDETLPLPPPKSSAFI